MSPCQYILSALLLLVVSANADAASILVNTTDDEFSNDGNCSLREAVASANNNTSFDDCNAGNAGADTILILVNGDIRLSEEIVVTETLSIQGLGMEATAIIGNYQTRHLLVDMPDDSSDFSISNLTLRDGRASELPAGSGINGGASVAIIGKIGALVIDSVRFLGNRTIDSELPSLGGAILVTLDTGVTASIEIRDSIFDRNYSEAGGGALHARAQPGSSIQSLIIERTRFYLNETGGDGEAIDASVAQFSIVDSVFEGNLASSDSCCNDGGALDLRPPAGSLSLIDRTSFIGNQAADGGGALYLDDGATLIRNTTFHANVAGEDLGQALQLVTGAHAAIFFSTLNDNGEGQLDDAAIWVCGTCKLDLTHSIVWASWSPSADCKIFSGSNFTSGGFNIDSSGTCTSLFSDLPMTDPKLFPLGDYGDSIPGLVIPTLLPRPESPAIEGGWRVCPGPFASNTDQDQRGTSRPVAGPSHGTDIRCDIGAVEFQPGDQPMLFQDRFESGG